MNNPFKSDRDIFGGIKRPIIKQSKQGQTQKKSSDLNFRSEFRDPSKTNQQRQKPNFQHNANTQINNNKLFKPYESSSSSQKYSPISNDDYAKKQLYNHNPKSSTNDSNNNQYAQYNRNPKAQKITFGNPLSSQDANINAKFEINNFKYDRNRYNNDQSSVISSTNQDLYSQSDLSYHSQSKYPANNNQLKKTKQYNFNKQSNDRYQAQQQFMLEDAKNKSMKSLNMSPIVEHSQHKFDNVNDMSDMMNLDNLGADIDKLLANSKNHEQLRRLIGLQQSNRKQKNQQSIHHQIQSNLGLQSNRLSNNQFGRQSQKPKTSQISENRETQYISQNPMAQYRNRQKQNPNNIPSTKTNIYQQNYRNSSQFRNQTNRNSTNIQNKQFDYSHHHSDSYQEGPGQVYDYGSSIKSNSIQQKQKIGNSLSNPSNDLQLLIQNQMKKVYQNGKHRIFLSASDKIQTIKYDLQYI